MAALAVGVTGAAAQSAGNTWTQDYNMADKFSRIGKGPNPFIDPAGYTAELDAVEGLFVRVLAEQLKAAGK